MDIETMQGRYSTRQNLNKTWNILSNPLYKSSDYTPNQYMIKNALVEKTKTRIYFIILTTILITKREEMHSRLYKYIQVSLAIMSVA